jgi:hypothetical protein
MTMDTGFIVRIMEVMTYAFIFAIGSLLLSVVAMYITDVTQARQASRSNYPDIERISRTCFMTAHI